MYSTRDYEVYGMFYMDVVLYRYTGQYTAVRNLTRFGSCWVSVLIISGSLSNTEHDCVHLEAETLAETPSIFRTSGGSVIYY
jgi:hypothetical protein